MEFRNESLRAHLADLAEGPKLYIPTPGETDLIDHLIGKNLERVQDELKQFRAQADALIIGAARDGKAKRHGINTDDFLEKYPVGCCEIITEVVRDLIRERAVAEIALPTHSQSILTRLQLLGVLKLVWGIQFDRFFQNGIQAGDYWLNPANNTCDADSKKTFVCGLQGSGFRNIKSVEDYLSIARKYDGIETYQNSAAPAVAPFAPVIQVNTKPTVRGKTPHPLIHTIESAVLADSFLNHGLDEIRRIYDSSKDRITDEQREQIAAAYKKTIKKRAMRGHVLSLPFNLENTSVEESFEQIERVLTAVRGPVKILEMINEILVAVVDEMLRDF